MSDQKRRFAIRVENTDYEASLILRKLYEIIPDEQGDEDDLIRIVDESGEDYPLSQERLLARRISSRGGVRVTRS